MVENRDPSMEELNAQFLKQELTELVLHLAPVPHYLIEEGSVDDLISYAHHLLDDFMHRREISPTMRCAIASFKDTRDTALQHMSVLHAEMAQLSHVIIAGITVLKDPKSPAESVKIVHDAQTKYVQYRLSYIDYAMRNRVAAAFLEQLFFLADSGGYSMLRLEAIQREAQGNAPKSLIELTGQAQP